MSYGLRGGPLMICRGPRAENSWWHFFSCPNQLMNFLFLGQPAGQFFSQDEKARIFFSLWGLLKIVNGLYLNCIIKLCISMFRASQPSKKFSPAKSSWLTFFSWPTRWLILFLVNLLIGFLFPGHPASQFFFPRWKGWKFFFLDFVRASPRDH